MITDSAGNALLLWTESSGGLATLRHRLYNVSSNSWTDILAGPSQAGPSAAPVMVGTPSGIAFAAWTEFTGTRLVIRTSRFLPGTGWEPSQTIGSDANLDSFEPRLAVGSDGRAIAVWLRGNAPPYDLMFSRFD